jgi:uncharacterized protein
VVYVVAKAPLAGHAKTRLTPPLSPEQAAALARAFLRDTVASAERSGAAVRLICRTPAERDALRALAGTVGTVGIDVQFGAGLGAALESAFVLGLRRGYRVVAVLGADTPTLPPSIVAEALAACTSEEDVALGPSDDGGYYLLATRRLHAALFRNMKWSTGDVAHETLRRARALGLRVRRLPQWSDVDDAASLARLRASLDAAATQVAPHTRAALDALVLPSSVTALAR